MVTWVLEKDVFSENCFNEMVNYFKTHDIKYHVVKVIPFIHEIDGEVPSIEGPVVVYGSIGSQKIATSNNWLPGIWTGDGVSENSVKEELGDDYLNNDMKIIKLREVSSCFSGEVFIKPVSDTKEFAGVVMSTEKIDLWVDNIVRIGYVEGNISDNDVCVSKPKNIGCEWRFVIVDGKISSFSCYKQYGKVIPEYWTTNEAIEFVKKCSKIYSPYDVYVMDVCQLVDGSYKVIEYNTFNSAGLYKCKISDIIEDINNKFK